MKIGNKFTIRIGGGAKMDEVVPEYGQVVAKHRKRLKMTQETLGRLTGLSQGAIHKIESGQREPMLSTASRIALALGTTIDMMLAEIAALRRNKTEGDTEA